jgi:hypothetical protein
MSVPFSDPHLHNVPTVQVSLKPANPVIKLGFQFHFLLLDGSSVVTVNTWICLQMALLVRKLSQSFVSFSLQIMPAMNGNKVCFGITLLTISRERACHSFSIILKSDILLFWQCPLRGYIVTCTVYKLAVHRTVQSVPKLCPICKCLVV